MYIGLAVSSKLSYIIFLFAGYNDAGSLFSVTNYFVIAVVVAYLPVGAKE